MQLQAPHAIALIALRRARDAPNWRNELLLLTTAGLGRLPERSRFGAADRIGHDLPDCVPENEALRW